MNRRQFLALAGLAAAGAATTSAHASPRRVALYAADPESWEGARKPVKLDGNVLRPSLGVTPRLNPRVLVEAPCADLLGVDVFLFLPTVFAFTPPPTLWRRASVTPVRTEWWARIGDVTCGAYWGIDEALTFTAPPGFYAIPYVITARGIQPVKRQFTIEIPS